MIALLVLIACLFLPGDDHQERKWRELMRSGAYRFLR